MQVASGEPHVYLALHLLHFACFAPEHRAALLQLEVSYADASGRSVFRATYMLTCSFEMNPQEPASSISSKTLIRGLISIHFAQALPFLLGLVRGNAEYELSRAALSLMVRALAPLTLHD